MEKKILNKTPPFPCRIIPEIIRHATGKEVITFEPIPIGVMTYKTLCKTKDNFKYILRVYPHGREDVLEKELQIIARCRELGLSVPNIIATSLNGPDIGLRYFVYPRIEGMMLSSYLKTKNPKIDYIGNQLIAIFDKLSSLQIKNSGELINGYSANYSYWSEFLADSIENGRNAFYNSNCIPKEKVRQVEDMVISYLKTPITSDNYFIWGDTGIDNILVEKNGKISGLIDFESCLSGPKNCTLGYFLNTLTPKIKTHESLANHLVSKSNALNEEIYSFSLLRAYRLAKFINRPLPTGIKRDLLIDIFPGLKWASDFFTDKIGVA